MSFGDYQIDLYLAALGGNLPAHSFDYAELERNALAALPPELRTYVAGGSGNEATQRGNVSAFERYALIPRMLRASAERDLSIELFGKSLDSPLLMAPVGVVGLCTPDQHGDIHAAEVSAATGVPLIGSTLMSDPLEDVVAATGDTPAWFQLYTPKNRDLAASLVSRAEQAGYEAIVITLDTWVPGWRPRDLASGNFPQLRGKALANYTSDPVFQEMTGPDPDLGTVVFTWVGTFGQPVTWDDLPWLRSLTNLPIVLKGICHPDDAKRALDEGADGIYCSNHGGRQANGGGAALDWLPGIVEAVADRAPVIFDSGVRTGADVVKALALG
ncbi:MAG: alpha-hydroxy-acid oxidizing protein, partial [Microbacterium sp.]